ncbi:porin [Archangium primigenium]|uniref:porin n=1 Tax=[Archangium] primigenium TaxID=2792470 RepID=UPI001EF83D70|nr:porin [Archangium primigenium]
MKLLALSWLALGSAVQAQSPAAPPAVEATPAQEPPPEKPAPPPVVVTAEPGRGIVVKAGERYSLGLRARIQLRETYLRADGRDTSETNVKTLRLIVHGNVLAPELRYTIQLAFGGPDFEAGSSSPIFDAYVDYTRWRDLNLRVGQFFVPFDRARTIREFALQFVDRQLVVRELTLDRDVGVMLSSSDFLGLGERLAYQVFIGGGDGRNRYQGYESGALSVLRLTLRPFGAFDDDQEGDVTRAPRPRLAVGVGAAYNARTSRRNSTYGTPFTAGTTSYSHLAADVVFKYRGFSLLAEALWRKARENELEGLVNGARVLEPTRSGYGYLVQGGLLVSPKVELTARWEELFTLRGTDPQFVQLARTQGKQLGGGLNVYLNGHAFKVQGDYFYIFGPEGTPRHTARLQLDASF